MKIILTSAGFYNKKVRNKFVEMINVDMSNNKILFVPTAAINDGGKAMLPICIEQIIESGILKDNIREIQIKEFVNIEDIHQYCAIYVAGGDTQHLVQEMQRNNFKNILDKYLGIGGVYFGVSAGSIALTNSFEGCLQYVNCKLNVHKDKGNKLGKINNMEYIEIDLTDNQAVIVYNDDIEIYG